MKISVVGAGYVGLTLAAVLAAEHGHEVWVIRRDEEKNKALKKGKPSFFEPGLEELVKKGLAQKRLFPTISYKEAIPFSEIVFIAVGTPSAKSGEADVSSVFKVAGEVGKNLKEGYTLVINKSTVPPGTTRKIKELIEKKKNKKADFDIVFSPEFLREGFAVSDTENPDRIVFGTDSNRAAKIFRQLHQAFKAPIVKTRIEGAEMIKYAANSYLALRIVFANQVADLCEKIGADVEEVIKGIGLDKRIGSHYWYPGLGYGGSCFPKDIAALSFFAKRVGEKDSLFEKMDELNKSRVAKILQKIERKFGPFSGKKIGILGLACKKGTDDVRNSPAIEVVKKLKEKGASLQAYDSLATQNAKQVLKGVSFCQDAYKVAKGADALFLLTDWPEFAKLDYKKIKRLMKGNFVFDSRNLLEPPKIKALGFDYLAVGR